MKKYIFGILVILAMFAGCGIAKAEKTVKFSVKQEGKTFIQQSNRGGSANSDIPTDFKWQDKKGNEYPIVLHQFTKGDKAGQWGAYVVKKSAKSGKEYKYYFPDNQAIAKTIREQMK